MLTTRKKLSLISLFVASTALLTGCSGFADALEYAPEEISSPHAVSWDKHEIIDDTHIRVWYEGGGGTPCREWSADVIESEDDIEITVVHGWLKETTYCEMSGSGTFTTTMTVETETPINDREITDGASSHPSSDTEASNE